MLDVENLSSGSGEEMESGLGRENYWKLFALGP